MAHDYMPDLARGPATDGLLVFAAASLTESMQELGGQFEKQAWTKIEFSFGGSNDLARQIAAGAPADVFFSADKEKMDGLEKSGFVRKEDRRDFLSNRLAVVVPGSLVLKRRLGSSTEAIEPGGAKKREQSGSNALIRPLSQY